MTMRFRQYGIMAMAALLAVPAVATAAHVRRGPTAHKVKTTKKKFTPGQRTIDSQRTTEIQSALVKAGYLQGTPSGQWDNQTVAAMQKLQSDNGWQTRITPDSRALIKLGLGPAATPTAPATQASLTTPTAAGVAPGSTTTAAK